MTRKHFEYAATLVRAIKDYGELPGIEVERLGDGNIDTMRFVAEQHMQAYINLFSNYAPRFDESRFRKACGFDN